MFYFLFSVIPSNVDNPSGKTSQNWATYMYIIFLYMYILCIYTLLMHAKDALRSTLGFGWIIKVTNVSDQIYRIAGDCLSVITYGFVAQASILSLPWERKPYIHMLHSLWWELCCNWGNFRVKTHLCHVFCTKTFVLNEQVTCTHIFTTSVESINFVACHD